MAEMHALPITPDVFGLTHGDFLMSNYLIDGPTVTVIDFDECEYSWYLMDLAICLRCYLLGDTPEQLPEKKAPAQMYLTNLLADYRKEYPAAEHLLPALNHFIALRDYIEIAEYLKLKQAGRPLGDMDERLLRCDLDRILHENPFLPL